MHSPTFQFVNSGNLSFEALQPIHRDKLAELFERFRYSKIDQYFHPHPLTTEEAFNKCSYRGADYYCLVFDGKNPVGYGMLRGWDEGYTEPSLGIAIDAHHQGRGIGRLLIGHLHEIAQTRGVKTVRLKVYKHNLGAIKLYKSIGYTFESISDTDFMGKIKLGSLIKRIAINTQSFVDWAGGTDFLFNIISALLATPLSQQTEFYVFIPKLSPKPWTKAWFKHIEVYLKGKIRGQNQHAMRNHHIQSLEQRLKEFEPRINLIAVRTDSKSQEQLIKDLQIDAILPLMRPSTLNVECGVVGYIYDFQHTQFPQFFSPRDIVRRNKLFHETLTGAKVVIVNAQAVAKDIKTFFPETTAEIIALPFTPAPRPDWLNERKEILEKYNTKGKYFIICNQFWEHKDHSTAFKAFALLASKHSEVTLVCTGNPTDSRNPNYFQTLKNLLTELKIEDRVKILGHIPKRDQIELLKHACAVLQPTLFEGGPGGGSIFDAVSLDIPALVSSIPVNQEIDCGRVSFFPPRDFNALAELMEKSLNIKSIKKTNSELLQQGEEKTRRCGEFLWRAIQLSRRPRSSMISTGNSKRLSVVIPTYNCNSLITNHLISVNKWIDLADEIIVVDSHSNDGTIEIIKEHLKHPRLRIIQRGLGLYESWNEGITATSCDWIYISTIGDTIEREHLLHLIDLGLKAQVDVVVSAPRFVNETGSAHRNLNWPPAKVIRQLGRKKPFILSKEGTVILSYLFFPQSLLGSSASNLYRGEHLRNKLFSPDFSGAGDTVWIIENAEETKLCFTPNVGSVFCVHPKSHVATLTQKNSILLKLIDKKRQVAERIKDMQDINVNLLREVSYFERKNSLHAKRRLIWHNEMKNVFRIFEWTSLTIQYLVFRLLLSIEHRRLKNILKKFPLTIPEA